VPLAFALPQLFPWAHADVVAQSDALRPQLWYLTPARFLVRNVVLLVVWCVLGLALVGWPGRREGIAARRPLSVAGLLVVLFTVTILAFDWIASPVPGWASTTLGLRLGTSEFLGSLAFAVVFVVLLRPGVRDTAPGRDFGDFGNLLLTYAMMWAYIAFTQYLIVWAEDLPDETSWFWPRAATSWRWMVWVVAFLCFALPVAAMLFRRLKRSPRTLALVCAAVLVGQWLDTYWLIVPTLRPHGIAPRLADLLALVGEGGLWLALVLHLARRIPAVPAPATSVTQAAHG
jgi:hypothetical protein